MKINFSVIIPTFNCKYIERSINSVINQSYKNWELIVIDNHSKNNVKKIVKNKKNKKIKFFKIKNDGIIGKSRNYGIKKSNFKWIAFLDSDDIWSENKLECIHQHIKKNKCDLIYHNMKIISENNFSFPRNLYNYSKKKLETSKYDDLILNGNDIIQSSVVVKKKILKKVNYISEKKKLIAWEDYDLWIKISKITNNFCLLDKSLGSYYVPINQSLKLKRFIKNIRNFKIFYKKEINQIKKKYNITNMWWIEYAEGLNFFKDKKYKKAYMKIKTIKNKNFKIKLYLMMMKFKFFLSKT